MVCHRYRAYFPLLFLATAYPATAQDTPCIHRTLTLNVFNAAGGLVRGLQPADLEAKLGGKEIKILSVKPDEPASDCCLAGHQRRRSRPAGR